MVMRPNTVLGLAHESFPSFLAQREKTLILDTWAKGRQGSDSLYMPRDRETADPEYKDLASRAPAPWLALVVRSLLETVFLDGVSRPGQQGNLEVYQLWLQNRFNALQIPLYRAAMEHGLSYVRVLPARNRVTGQPSALWTPFSAKKMSAFYEEPHDEYPQYALKAVKFTERDAQGNTAEQGWQVELIDDQAVHYLSCKGNGYELKDWSYISYEEHRQPFCPVIQYHFETDLDGEAVGQVEPLIPLAGRIDQDTFDRLIVQRFGAWKIRYITGLVKPADISDEQHRANLIKLKVGDFLISNSKDTKFGTLDETQLEGFIKAADADVRTLAAVSQTPPHHMLGLSANMQAESLAAAEAGLQRKSAMFKVHTGESHELLFRTSAYLVGNREEASAYDMKSRWKDMESRSFEQAAQALGILATQVGVPQEMLFEMIPNWDDTKVARAKELVESGAIDRLLSELDAQQQPTTAATGA